MMYRQGIIKTIKSIYKQGKLPAFLLSLLIISNGALIPLSAYFTRNLIDVGVSQLKSRGSIAPVFPWVIAFISVLVLYNLRELGEQILNIKLSHKLRDNLMPVITAKYSKMEYACFEDRETRNLLSRVGSSPEETLTNMFWEFLFLPQTILEFAGLCMIFFSAGWWVLIGIVLIAIPTLIISTRNIKDNQELRLSQTERQRRAGYLSSLITSRPPAKELRIFGLYDYLNTKWYTAQMEMLDERVNNPSLK